MTTFLGTAGFTQAVQATMETVACCRCGVLFALTAQHVAALRESCATFYCPNQHPLRFGGPSEAEKAKAEADRLRRNLQWEREELERVTKERDHAERRRRSVAGKNTILKRRLANGLCPCCKTSFPDLAAHITEAHPGYGVTDETTPEAS